MMTDKTFRQVDDSLLEISDMEIFEMARGVLGHTARTGLQEVFEPERWVSENGYSLHGMSAYARGVAQEADRQFKAEPNAPKPVVPVVDLVSGALDHESGSGTLHIRSDAKGFRFEVRPNPEPATPELLAGIEACLCFLRALSMNLHGVTGTLVGDQAFHTLVVLDSFDRLPRRFEVVHCLAKDVVLSRQFDAQENWAKALTETQKLDSAEKLLQYAGSMVPAESWR